MTPIEYMAADLKRPQRAATTITSRAARRMRHGKSIRSKRCTTKSRFWPSWPQVIRCKQRRCHCWFPDLDPRAWIFCAARFCRMALRSCKVAAQRRQTQRHHGISNQAAPLPSSWSAAMSPCSRSAPSQRSPETGCSRLDIRCSMPVRLIFRRYCRNHELYAVADFEF